MHHVEMVRHAPHNCCVRFSEMQHDLIYLEEADLLVLVFHVLLFGSHVGSF